MAGLLEFILRPAVGLEAFQHELRLRLGKRPPKMLFVELHPLDPCLYLTFEYIVRLALVTVYDAMTYFVNEHGGFYLL